MPIPAYMWLKDHEGTDIKGSVNAQGRKGSIEVTGFSHGLNTPVDSHSGKTTGPRVHSPIIIEKAFDASSPYLYQAVATDQLLKSAELRWYRLNEDGQEEVYFIMTLTGVKITGVNPYMPGIKVTGESPLNHTESITVIYEKITWRYVDSNVQYVDNWEFIEAP